MDIILHFCEIISGILAATSASSAPGLFAQPDIDGGLVGGASLKPDCD